MTYLLAASIAVSIVIYLYNAYQGDSTVFMLTAVVTLMVFNGGDAEGAFLYGVDRAYMTAFGVIVYTVVASTLWPVKTGDNTRTLAAGIARGYGQAFARLVRPQTFQEPPLDDQLATLLADEEAFQTQFARVKNSADGVTDYLPEWNTVVSCYEELEAALIPALQHDSRQHLEYGRYISNYHELVEHVDSLFRDIDSAWQGTDENRAITRLDVAYNADSLQQGKHLTAAAVATRAELLERLQDVLLDLQLALGSLLFDRGGLHATRQPRGKPAFIWLDQENFKTALRAFTTFWIATAIWIQFNPPGGFMFVTLCTILIPLVSYTPVTPKLLFILFTLGFLFALPAYVFLLPQMTHWFELAAFLFSYAFIGFYVFQGPVSIFFLLGLFTLGIQNTMSYHFDAIALTILMFYMICATLIIAVYFPFTSKPERIYASLRRRFFLHCARSIRSHAEAPTLINRLSRISVGNGAALLTKMQFWGARIDPAASGPDGAQQLAALNRACELLHGQLQIMALRQPVFSNNPLVVTTRRSTRANPLAKLCETLAAQQSQEPFAQLKAQLGSIEERLDELLGDDYLQRYDRLQLAQFYVYLSLQVSVLDSIEDCRAAQQALDWQQLGETRF
jgi:hypothetical protein